jgi:hypothetical protein
MAVLPEVFEAAAHAAMSNYDLALDLARQGVHVFPCQPDGEHEKKPCSGVFWRTASTCNETRIRQWWDRWPEALPGIDLAKAGLVVIDCDRKPNRPDGVAAFAALSRGHPDLTAPVVETANGGLHYYFRQWAQHGNGTGSMPPGIDVRGHGGYVIAPGATFLDGRRYEPVEGSFLDATECPAWIVEILQGSKPLRETATARYEPGPPVSDERKRMYGETALDAEIGELASAAPGTRNETANRIAFRIGQLVGGGCLTEREAYAALHNAATSWGIPANDKALGPRGTIMRGLRAGTREPRGPPEDIADNVGAGIVARLLERPDGSLQDVETGEIYEPPVKIADDADELPDSMSRIPGVLGDLTEWICDTSRRPQRGLALGAALTILGTACGRHLSGPTGSGTHLYVIGLAPTGAGKDHALQQISAVLDAAGMRQHIGPSQFISMPAVINFIARSPLSCCAMDEFGSFLKRINNKRASGFEGAISGILRTAWGTSFRPMTTPEWAGRASETIMAPAMSVYGASTPEEFYGALEGGDMSNGVLNRLLIIETRKRPDDRDPSIDPFTVPDHIIDGVKSVYERMGQLVAAQLNRFDARPNHHKMPWGSGAAQAYRALVDDINVRCDGDAMAQAFYARTAEMALRLATIRAAGINPRNPVLDEGSMRWGSEIALWSARVMSRGALDHISESDNQGSIQLVRRAIKEAGGRIRHRDLLRRINHKVSQRDLKSVLESLAGAEEIDVHKITPEGGGRPSVWYVLT